MTDSGPARTGPQRFVVGAAPSVRSLLAAAVGTLVGALLLVVWAAANLSTAVAVAGAVLMVLGIGLALSAAWAYRRFHQTLILDDDTITVVSARRRRIVSWSDVSEVRTSGSRLVLVARSDGKERDVRLNPGGYSELVLADLVQAIRARLDADRGYRELS